MGRPEPGLALAGPAPSEGPLLPDYGGACLTGVVPALLALCEAPEREPPGFVPDPLHGARQVVLLVVDGLGQEALAANHDVTPVLSSLAGGPITSVAPTTTASALTSLTTGAPPAAHGLLGYRMRLGDEVLNVLRWSTASGDARTSAPPSSLQPLPPFGGRAVPVVSRAEFAGTGFTEAHLRGARLVGWRVASSLPVEVRSLLRAGERFVYAYYDGLDKVAHDVGLGEHFRAELAAVDRLVADLLAVLPAGAVLAVTADHGQVHVPGEAIELADEVAAAVHAMSGEGRFRWLHVRPGGVDDVVAACEACYGDVAWVRTRDELVAAGIFGGPLGDDLAARLGDVALLARAPVAFRDPGDTGELRLVARHGSLTPEELHVPFLAGRP
ncbi:MAG TPA: alkaline phosphatase family protein [Acidimicrobiales bacterium]|nr:alkaline phosphatase family protein [Acidimicrobiales bacterium]